MKEMEQQSIEMSSRADDIKKSAALQIQAARFQFKQKMEKMRRAAERKRKEGKQKLNEVRTSMAAIVVNDNKVGNYSLCSPKQTETERTQYCTKNFVNEPDKLRDCNVSADDYCYVCCENEFGRNKQEFRDRCYKLCDAVESGKDSKGSGFWSYVPGTNAISGISSVSDASATPPAGSTVA